jgi:hypothetical protein
MEVDGWLGKKMAHFLQMVEMDFCLTGEAAKVRLDQKAEESHYHELKRRKDPVPHQA